AFDTAKQMCKRREARRMRVDTLDSNGRVDWFYAGRPVPSPSDDDVAAALLAFRHLRDAEVWALCVKRDERIEQLRKSVTWLAGDRFGFCATAVWRSTFKPCLSALVGWSK